MFGGAKTQTRLMKYIFGFPSPSPSTVLDIWAVLLLTTLHHDAGHMGSGRVSSSVLLN